MHKCFLLLLLFFVLRGGAQNSYVHKPKPVYFSTNQAIHFEGSAGSDFGVQSVHGVAYKSWTLGGGVGLDLYRMRTVPVFMQVKRAMPIQRFPLFIYAEAGPNFVWTRRDDMLQVNNGDSKRGYYWDAGLQYQAPLSNKTALVFSAGLSEKTFSESYVQTFWCGTSDCPQINNRFDYKFRRLALKAGFGF